MVKPAAEQGAIGGNSGAQLRAIIARIEAQNERVATEKDDLKEIYEELKAFGFIPKIVRKIVARRAMDKAKRDEEDALIETYEGALGAE